MFNEMKQLKFKELLLLNKTQLSKIQFYSHDDDDNKSSLLMLMPTTCSVKIYVHLNPNP